MLPSSVWICTHHNSSTNTHPSTRPNPNKRPRSQNTTPALRLRTSTLTRNTQRTHENEDRPTTIHIRYRRPQDRRDASEENGDRGVVAGDGNRDVHGFGERDEGAVDDGLAEGAEEGEEGDLD
jgi:hypothetical protein